MDLLVLNKFLTIAFCIVFSLLLGMVVYIIKEMWLMSELRWKLQIKREISKQWKDTKKFINKL